MKIIQKYLSNCGVPDLRQPVHRPLVARGGESLCLRPVYAAKQAICAGIAMAPSGVNCAGCRAVITEGIPFMRCVKCKQFFDLLCSNFTAQTFAALSPELKSTWICVECRSRIPRGDNSHTPVRQPVMHNMSIGSECPADISMSSPDNVTVRTGSRYARAASRNEQTSSSLDEMRVSIVQDLKDMQDNFEKRLSIKLGNLLCDQFNTFKSELFNLVTGLTGRITELEKKIETMTNSSNSTVNKNIESQMSIVAPAPPPLQTGPPSTPTYNALTRRQNKKTDDINSTNKKVIAPAPVVITPDIPKVVESTSSSLNTVAVEDDLAGNWVEVRPKKHLRASLPNVLRGTAAPGVTSLRAAERWRSLHLYYVLEGTTPAEVQAHLKSICGSDVCTVEELKSRGRYSSFKLGVPAKFAECVMSPKNWAEDICVKPWRQNFRTKEKITK